MFIPGVRVSVQMFIPGVGVSVHMFDVGIGVHMPTPGVSVYKFTYG